jgi:hypothetical protein
MRIRWRRSLLCPSTERGPVVSRHTCRLSMAYRRGMWYSGASLGAAKSRRMCSGTSRVLGFGSQSRGSSERDASTGFSARCRTRLPRGRRSSRIPGRSSPQRCEVVWPFSRRVQWSGSKRYGMAGIRCGPRAAGSRPGTKSPGDVPSAGVNFDKVGAVQVVHTDSSP